MKFNWNNLLASLPYIIAGIQAIHNDLPGTSKKQKAMEALGLATAVAVVVLPTAQSAQAQAVSNAVGSIIDSIVAFNHATNVPGFGGNSIPKVQP